MYRLIAAAATLLVSGLISVILAVIVESMYPNGDLPEMGFAAVFITFGLRALALSALLAIFIVPEGDNWRQLGGMGLIGVGLFVSSGLPMVLPMQSLVGYLLWFVLTIPLIAGGWWLFYESTGVH